MGAGKAIVDRTTGGTMTYDSEENCRTDSLVSFHGGSPQLCVEACGLLLCGRLAPWGKRWRSQGVCAIKARRVCRLALVRGQGGTIDSLLINCRTLCHQRFEIVLWENPPFPGSQMGVFCPLGRTPLPGSRVGDLSPQRTEIPYLGNVERG